jgi:acetyl-CoA acetyltransferase
MLAALFKATFARTGVDPAHVGDVVIGSVLGPSSQRANECRIAMFLAGMPEAVPVHTVNRCGKSESIDLKVSKTTANANGMHDRMPAILVELSSALCSLLTRRALKRCLEFV